MKIVIENTSKEMAKKAAKMTAIALNEVIASNGYARLLLSTGASQLEAIEELVKQDVKWGAVEMFHLDEYIDLPITHAASFRKYLQERFVDIVKPMNAVFVSGEGDIEKVIEDLNAKVTEKPVDVALIGIGENAHVAFNDPPANFDIDTPYIVVTLDDACKKQQMGEGWFATIDDVPKKAISMSVKQILKSKKIISIVPNKQKAKAIKDSLSSKTIDPMVPGSILKTHPDWTLFLDSNSSSEFVPFL